MRRTLLLLLICLVPLILTADSHHPLVHRPDVCEFCDMNFPCKPNLICLNGVCERETSSKRCESHEVCDSLQFRRCRMFRPNFADSMTGQLKDEYVRKRYFIGSTILVASCMSGYRKFPCDKLFNVCKPMASRFCLELSLRECKDKGVVRQQFKGNDTDSCCLVLNNTDCYRRELCRCEWLW